MRTLRRLLPYAFCLLVGGVVGFFLRPMFAKPIPVPPEPEYKLVETTGVWSGRVVDWEAVGQKVVVKVETWGKHERLTIVVTNAATLYTPRWDGKKIRDSMLGVVGCLKTRANLTASFTTFDGVVDTFRLEPTIRDWPRPQGLPPADPVHEKRNIIGEIEE